MSAVDLTFHDDWSGERPQVRRSRPTADRFWEKVNKNGPIPDYAPHLGPCWLWTGSSGWKGKNKYGTFSLAGRKMIAAYKWAWEATNGSVPKGLELDHLCRVTLCIRPSHLEAVTHRENLIRARKAQPPRTHCRFGHSLEGARIRAYDGQPLCRTCVQGQRDRRRAKRARRAA